MDRNRCRAGPLLKEIKRRVDTLWSRLRALTQSRFSLPEPISVNWIAGNFLMGDFFGAVKCRYGHPVRLFNISRGHFVACDECRTYVFVGSNLMSCWREETEDIWRRNSESVEGYEFIE